MGRELLTEQPAKLVIQQTQFVSCCVISAHTQREKEGERQEHLASWRGSGFAECGEKAVYSEGRRG